MLKWRREINVAIIICKCEIYKQNQYLGIRLGRFCRFTTVFGQNYESVAEDFYFKIVYFDFILQAPDN